jgi:hypothetical protein
VGAPAVTAPATFRCAWRVWLTTAATIALIAALTALVAQDAAQRSLVLSFPARTNYADLMVVLVHNGALTGAVLLAAARPSRSLDVALSTIWLANIVLAGVALGGYGWRLLTHAGVYGAVELAACSIPIAVYMNARAERAAPTIRDAVATATLVALAAVVETVLPLPL